MNNHTKNLFISVAVKFCDAGAGGSQAKECLADEVALRETSR